MGPHSIHHVTAVTAEVGRNLRYYTETLGLRLVKKTVNQDDVSAYHLFYADAVGTPGTDLTFFDWPDSPAAVPGAGTVALTSFRVPAGSLDWWEQRLEHPLREEDEAGMERLLFVDPEGQRLELVEASELPGGGQPWTAEVPEEYAIRGILGVDLESANPQGTRAVLIQILGYRESEAGEDVFIAASDTHFGRVRIVPSFSGRRGRSGSGGVHHVAFRVADEDELNRFKAELDKFGIGNSGIVERYYFTSLYFREPGGVLFELATDGPGFAADEDVDRLGERLSLPPFLEGRREEIEGGLKPIGS